VLYTLLYPTARVWIDLHAPFWNGEIGCGWLFHPSSDAELVGRGGSYWSWMLFSPGCFSARPFSVSGPGRGPSFQTVLAEPGVPLLNTASGDLYLDYDVKGDNDPGNFRTPPSVSSSVLTVDLQHKIRTSAGDNACR
jgi:hypothetical protein